MIRDKKDGVLGFEIIDKALKVAWVNRFVTDHEENASWIKIPLSCLKTVGGIFFFHCNFKFNKFATFYVTSTIL
jgi:hypothetical protein